MMAKTVQFRILVGVDGSKHARAALAALIEGPWPDVARVRAVVARQTLRPHQRSLLLSALDHSADDAAESARRTLADKWPDAEAIVVDKAPIDGILTEAKNFRADVIVVGWRGYGPARRLLMGSVSRAVVRAAKCAVLVVRRRPREPIRNIMLAFDGSANARRAVSLVARLSPARGRRVTLVGVAELMVPTSRGPSVAGIRASVDRGLKRINSKRSRVAIKALNRAARELRRAGWRTRTVLRTGEPLRELIDSVRRSQAALLVVGARGTSGVRRLLLGSVADGVLNQSPVPVLLAR
jgi:nucleotide-binding universal stress UspA family protein